MTNSLLHFRSISINLLQRLAKLSIWLRASAGYFMLVCLAYTSIVTHWASAIPGLSSNSDYSIFYWNIWWFQHAIFHLGQDPFYTNYILYPHTLNLAYHTLTPFLDVSVLPIYALFGSTIAINTFIVSALSLNGVALFAFLRHHSVSNGLAFVAGAFYAFMPFITARMSFVHLNLLLIAWLPLSALAWDRLLERRSILSTIGLAVVVYAAFMTDQQFGLLLVLLLPLYALYTLVRVHDWRIRAKVLALSGLALGILIGLMLIAPLPEILAGRNVNYPTVSLDQAQVRAMTLSDVIGLPDRFIDSEQVPLGVLLPIGIVIGLIRGRRAANRWLWFLIGILFLILSFGPTLDPLNIPLPYRLLHTAMGSTFRVPARFVLPAEFGLIIFVALSLQNDYQRLSHRAKIVSVVLVLVLLGLENRWGEPFPIFTLPDYQIYHTIGADPDEYTLLEVPVGAHNTIARAFGSGFELEYYSGVHHKRLINGSVSRAAAGITASYRQWPLITALAGEGPPPDASVARDNLLQLSKDWDIRYVLVHRELLSPELDTWAIGFFNTQPDWCLVDEEGSLLAYHRLDSGDCSGLDLLNPPTDGTINLGDGDDDRYLGLGWYPSENVGGPQARWTGSIPTSTLKLHLAAQSYRILIKATSDVPNQVVTVLVNDVSIASMSFGAGWGEYAFNLPVSSIPPNGLVTLAFKSAYAQSAYDRSNGQVDDRRPLAVAYDSLSLTPDVSSP